MFNPFKKPKSKQPPSVIPAKAGIHKSSTSVIASFGTPNRGNLTPQTESLTLHLSGLHCTSCATNIDLTLEDLPSVKSNTSYAKSETKIEFDPSQTDLDTIKNAITELGYPTH